MTKKLWLIAWMSLCFGSPSFADDNVCTLFFKNLVAPKDIRELQSSLEQYREMHSAAERTLHFRKDALARDTDAEAKLRKLAQLDQNRRLMQDQFGPDGLKNAQTVATKILSGTNEAQPRDSERKLLEGYVLRKILERQSAMHESNLIQKKLDVATEDKTLMMYEARMREAEERLIAKGYMKALAPYTLSAEALEKSTDNKSRVATNLNKELAQVMTVRESIGAELKQLSLRSPTDSKLNKLYGDSWDVYKPDNSRYSTEEVARIHQGVSDYLSNGNFEKDIRKETEKSKKK